MTKADFLTRQFSRAEKKRYEHYVVTRIWHLLNDLDIKAVTQQYVSRLEGYALTDLFFPQLQVHIEIDEGHHKNQIHSDNLREVDIINATGHEIIRIDVTQNIKIIHAVIDEAVVKIRTKRNSIANFKPWDIEAEQNPKTYIEKEYIDLIDDCAFKTMVDAANCFGNSYKEKGIWKGGAKHPKEQDKLIWFPKLYKNGKWNNSISVDEKTINEICMFPDMAKTHIDSVIKRKIFNRIVFARVKSPLGDIMYRFKGLYHLDQAATNYEQGLVWRRIAERVMTYDSEEKAAANKG
jgi:very-short-patch-repair endonuclease